MAAIKSFISSVAFITLLLGFLIGFTLGVYTPSKKWASEQPQQPTPATPKVVIYDIACLDRGIQMQDSSAGTQFTLLEGETPPMSMSHTFETEFIRVSVVCKKIEGEWEIESHLEQVRNATLRSRGDQVIVIEVP